MTTEFRRFKINYTHIWRHVLESNELATWLLYPPCVADADVIFLPRGFFFFFLLSFFFPRLISAVADWMSTILPHMVWPWCEFGMQVWNVLHASIWILTFLHQRNVRNVNYLVYLVHRSIIFDSCLILGMLIKGVIYRLRRPLRQK